MINVLHIIGYMWLMGAAIFCLKMLQDTRSNKVELSETLIIGEIISFYLLAGVTAVVI